MNQNRSHGAAFAGRRSGATGPIARQAGGVTDFVVPAQRQAAPRPAPRKAQSFFSAIPSHVWVPILLTYACLMPRELTVEVAGADLFPYRAFLFVLAPFAISQAFKHVPRLNLIDLFVAIAAIWHIIALLVTESITAAIVTGGSRGADFALAYLVGRATLRSPDNFRVYFLAVLPGFAAAAAMMAVESLQGRLILRPFLADLLGKAMERVKDETRFGLYRAAGPFPHPILGGVFLAATIPLAWYLPRRMTTKIFAIMVSLGCIFSVSSGAIIAFILCVTFMVMNWVQRISKFPVFLTAGIYFFLAYLAVSAVSQNGPLSVFTRYVLLDSSSSYYRQLIWEYAGAEVVNNPFFGIGLRDWERPEWMVNPSVDSYWLISAMLLGLPMAIASFLTNAGTVAALAVQCRRAPPDVRRTAFAIGTSLVAVIFSGFTVHLWEGVAAWMLMVTGAGVTLSQWRLQYVPQRLVAPSPLMRVPPHPPKRSYRLSPASQIRSTK